MKRLSNEGTKDGAMQGRPEVAVHLATPGKMQDCTSTDPTDTRAFCRKDQRKTAESEGLETSVFVDF